VLVTVLGVVLSDIVVPPLRRLRVVR